MNGANYFPIQMACHARGAYFGKHVWQFSTRTGFLAGRTLAAKKKYRRLAICGSRLASKQRDIYGIWSVTGVETARHDSSAWGSGEAKCLNARCFADVYIL